MLTKSEVLADAASSQPGKADTHHRALDGLRGWAALAVVLYHSILHYGPSLTGVMIQAPASIATFNDAVAWAVLNGANGSFAVTLFFILSGLVLAESLQRGARDPAGRFCLAFAVRRLFRLMPPLVVSVVFAFLVGHAMVPLGLSADRVRSVADLWDNLLLWSFSVNGATWTIQVEMLIVPVLLAIFLLQRLLGPIVFFLALVAAIQIVPLTTLFAPKLVYLNDALLAFAAGMLLAQPWIKPGFKSTPRSMAWVLLLAYLFSRPVLGWGSTSAVITQILLGTALIGHLTVNASSLAGFLNNAASQFLGRISYSFYLLNVPMIWVIAACLPFGVPSQDALSSGLVLFLVVSLLSIPLALLSVRYIEQPSTALGRRLGRIIADGPGRPPVASLGRALRVESSNI